MVVRLLWGVEFGDNCCRLELVMCVMKKEEGVTVGVFLSGGGDLVWLFFV